MGTDTTLAPGRSAQVLQLMQIRDMALRISKDAASWQPGFISARGSVALRAYFSSTCAFFVALLHLSISPALEGFLHYTSYKDTAPFIFSSHVPASSLPACDLAYGFASCLITAGVNSLFSNKYWTAKPTRPYKKTQRRLKKNLKSRIDGAPSRTLSAR